MLSLGIDLGSSSLKTCLYNAKNNQVVAAAQYPEHEMPIESMHPGWAEQHPEMWWDAFLKSYRSCLRKANLNPKNIRCIGISYQMHGLVCLDSKGTPLRNAIIWCDSRAVQQGKYLSAQIGNEIVQKHLLNEPGNFTASKLLWVKENEPKIYEKIDKVCLPGDYIAYKLTGKINTTIGGLSEGIFYDFVNNEVSQQLMNGGQLDNSHIPENRSTFSHHGMIHKNIADELSLSPDTVVSYKAGDQPNNAFSLNVLHPGEVATTAGTSGVIYAVTDKLVYDVQQRYNTFAHVNYQPDQVNLGSLLCINGVGISNAWIKRLTSASSYTFMNQKASEIKEGSEGLCIHPFGNGAERMFANKFLGASISNMDYVRHGREHLYRASLEGVAYAFKFGMDILCEQGVRITSLKAGNANMYLSPIFRSVLASLSEVPIYLYNTDGATGAAKGALVGLGEVHIDEIHKELQLIQEVEPQPALTETYRSYYQNWKKLLDQKLQG